MGSAGGRNGSIYYASGIRSKTFEISRIEGGRHIQKYLALTEKIIPKAIHTSQFANLLQSMHYFDKDFLLFGLLMCLASYFFLPFQIYFRASRFLPSIQKQKIE